MSRPVVLLLPGQGAQFPGMATGLHTAEPTFAAELDAVFEAMGTPGAELREDWLSPSPRVPVDHVTRSAPLLFAFAFALGRTLTAAGLRPWAVLGHSIGEWAAAALAGVFDPADAARVACHRAVGMARTPPGGMLAVAAPADTVRKELGWPAGADSAGGVWIGAVNAPRQIVLAGLDGPLAAAATALVSAGVVVRTVPATTAFHTPALAGVAERDRDVIAALAIGEPSSVVFSSRAGGRLARGQWRDPAFWSGIPAAPVRFWAALDAVLATDVVLVECGPGQQLSTVARQHPAVRSGRSVVVPLSPARVRAADAEPAAFRQAVETLRAQGHPLRLPAPSQGSIR